MLRTALWTLVFAVLMALVVYYSIGATAGVGLSILRLIATAAALLLCGAVAIRRFLSLRLLLALGALCMAALLVDQVAYSGWHERVDRFVTGLQRDVETGSPELAAEMALRPASLSIGSDHALVLNFEPPLLAWTYHLDATAAPVHGLIEGWFRVLATVPRTPDVDEVARSILRPHEAYSVKVMTHEEIATCRSEDAIQWIVSVDSHGSHRPL